MSELTKEINSIREERGDRYGPLKDNLSAWGLLRDILFSGGRHHVQGKWPDLTYREMQAWEGCLEMALLKMIRAVNDPTGRDHYIDAINYLEHAYEIAQETFTKAPRNPL